MEILGTASVVSMEVILKLTSDNDIWVQALAKPKPSGNTQTIQNNIIIESNEIDDKASKCTAFGAMTNKGSMVGQSDDEDPIYFADGE